MSPLISGWLAEEILHENKYYKSASLIISGRLSERDPQNDSCYLASPLRNSSVNESREWKSRKNVTNEIHEWEILKIMLPIGLRHYAVFPANESHEWQSRMRVTNERPTKSGILVAILFGYAILRLRVKASHEWESRIRVTKESREYESRMRDSQNQACYWALPPWIDPWISVKHVTNMSTEHQARFCGSISASQPLITHAQNRRVNREPNTKRINLRVSFCKSAPIFKRVNRIHVWMWSQSQTVFSLMMLPFPPTKELNIKIITNIRNLDLGLVPLNNTEYRRFAIGTTPLWQSELFYPRSPPLCHFRIVSDRDARYILPHSFTALVVGLCCSKI